jgi:hypothetical protein
MSYKPFLGSINPKTQKMRKLKGRGVEIGKYVREWYDDPLVATLFPRVTHLLGNHVNHQGETRKKV